MKPESKQTLPIDDERFAQLMCLSMQPGQEEHMLELFHTTLSSFRMIGANPPITPLEAGNLARQAITAARAKHPDFDQCVPALMVLSLKWICNWTMTTLDQQIEMLLLVLKHASFTSELRRSLAGMTQAPKGKQ